MNYFQDVIIKVLIIAILCELVPPDNPSNFKALIKVNLIILNYSQEKLKLCIRPIIFYHLQAKLNFVLNWGWLMRVLWPTKCKRTFSQSKKYGDHVKQHKQL